MQKKSTELDLIFSVQSRFLCPLMFNNEVATLTLKLMQAAKDLKEAMEETS